jgi:hypothetical protein
MTNLRKKTRQKKSDIYIIVEITYLYKRGERERERERLCVIFSFFDMESPFTIFSFF